MPSGSCHGDKAATRPPRTPTPRPLSCLQATWGCVAAGPPEPSLPAFSWPPLDGGLPAPSSGPEPSPPGPVQPGCGLPTPSAPTEGPPAPRPPARAHQAQCPPTPCQRGIIQRRWLHPAVGTPPSRHYDACLPQPGLPTRPQVHPASLRDVQPSSGSGPGERRLLSVSAVQDLGPVLGHGVTPGQDSHPHQW